MSPPLELYRLEKDRCLSMNGLGDPEQFFSEYSYIKYFTDKISEEGLLGDVRFTVLKESDQVLAFGEVIDATNSVRVQGLRSSQFLQTSEIISSLGSNA